jgi:predicted DNA-binding ribbon-helix-helix protein
MTEFVRYSAGVEAPDPNFDSALQVVLEDLRQQVRSSPSRDGAGLAIRNAHAKGYGLARAEVEILADIPPEYAQGIYAKPGRHEAMVRFSNGQPHMGIDRVLGATCGIGLKIFGVEGRKLLEDEPDSNTFDYAMINFPIFFANTVEHYIFVLRVGAQATAPASPTELPQERRARIARFLHDFVTGQGTLDPENWAWEELAAIAQFAQIPFVNLLLSTYHTMGAVRHGDFIAKLRVAPVTEFADRVQRRSLDPNSATQIFRPALITELKERPYEFNIQVQLCTSLYDMPVEDVTVRWPEALSPFVTVAKLRLPQQDISGDDNLDLMDATSMSPWRVTEEHRPLGNIMRSRKEVYRVSSTLRHQINRQVRKEPENLAEVFGDGAAVERAKVRTPTPA